MKIDKRIPWWWNNRIIKRVIVINCVGDTLKLRLLGITIKRNFMEWWKRR